MAGLDKFHSTKYQQYIYFYTGSEKKFNIKRITQHSSYKYESDTNDVAIMEMSSKTKFGKDINRICLPTQNEVLPIGSKCYITGKIGNDFTLLKKTKTKKNKKKTSIQFTPSNLNLF